MNTAEKNMPLFLYNVLLVRARIHSGILAIYFFVQRSALLLCILQRTLIQCQTAILN